LRASGTLPHPPTFFEVTTAIAFEIFRRAGITAAVIEVGLGGRFDATNVVTPVVTVITSIALDHERHLGDTLGQIAFEKAGIIKPRVPVVVGPLPAEARTVIRHVARAADAVLVEALASYSGTPVPLALNGAHQRHNAAIAVETLRLCSGLGHPIGRDHLVSALTDVEWPARLEWLRVPGMGDVLLDAAHNPAGAEALADYVLVAAAPLPLVFGVMKDKDVDAIVRALARAASRFITTTAASPRACDPRELADRIRRIEPTVSVDSNPDPAMALREACHPTGRAMVAGSIFLVGPIRGQLIAQGAIPVRYPSNAPPFYLS
jgi:dihydrofolate synthase/folylpolyglutamate synthase